MRWSVIFLTILSVSLVFSVKLTGVNVVDSSAAITVELTFDSYPSFSTETDISKTIFSIVIKDMDISFMTMPVHIGPLEMVRFAKVGKEAYIIFYSLVPTKPVVKKSGSTIMISFRKSPKRINISFESGIKLEEVIKYLSEYLNLNVILSSEVSKMGIPSIMLNDVTPEDAIRAVLISVPGVAYSYFPDGTLYIGKAGGDISEKFNKFWGIYSVKSPEVAEAVSEIIPGAIAEYLKRKSILLVYGGPAIHTKVAEVLSGKRGYEVVSVKNPEEAVRVLEELFEASVTYLPPDKVVLKGDLPTVMKMKDVLEKLGIVGEAKEKIVMKSSDVEIDLAKLEAYAETLKEIQEFVSKKTNCETLKVEYYPSLKKVAVYGSDEKAVLEALNMANEAAQKYKPHQPAIAPEKGKEEEKGRYSIVVNVQGGIESDVIKELKSYVMAEKEATVEIYSYPKIGKVIVESDDKDAALFVKNFLEFLSKEDVIVEYVKVGAGFQYDSFVKVIGKILPTLVALPVKDTRLIILSGKKDEIARAKGILDLFERPDLIVKIIEYPTGIPIKDLLGMLKDRFPALKSVVMENRGIVLVAGRKEDVDKFQAIIEDLEKQLESVPGPVTESEATETKIVTEMGGKFYIDASGVPLAKVIKEVFRLSGKSIIFLDYPGERVYMSVSGIDFSSFEKVIDLYGYEIKSFYKGSLLKKKETEEKVTKPIERGKYIVFKVSHNTDKITEMVKHFDGNIFVDEVSGVSIISGIEDEEAMRIVTSYIKELSEAPKQIEIEVKLVDEILSDGNSKSWRTSLGLPIGTGSATATGEGLNLSTDIITLTQYEKLLESLAKGTVSIGFSGSISGEKANIIAAPKVVTSSGEEARVFIGDKAIYTLPGGTPLELLYGVELIIRPTYRPDGTIDLDISVKVSDYGSPQGGTTIPPERMREATTRVTVKEGETVVIGGLLREITDKTVTKLPLLGDLPIIGELFKSTNESKEKRNLTIFITARVVNP